jgi:mannitol/fructose-specific phosphotransferase system IIA component (Ntr-type)
MDAVVAPLQILDYLDRDSIAVGLSCAGKAAALDLMVDLAVSSGKVDNADALMTALRRREAIVSTGVGNGVAIPHADVPELTEPRLAMGVFPEGVDFESLDEAPVFVVFLLLGTPRTSGLHMKILARIARLSKDPAIFRELRASQDADAALRVLEAIESRH